MYNWNKCNEDKEYGLVHNIKGNTCSTHDSKQEVMLSGLGTVP